MSKKFVKKHVIKLVLGGDGAVGKTLIANKLVGEIDSDSPKMTPGLDIHSMGLSIKQNPNIKLQVWDLGGQELFRFFQDFFFNEAKIVVLVFSVDLYHSFFNLVQWLAMVPKENVIKLYLLGNKIDIENRAVTTEFANQLADAYEMEYFEISALNGEGFETFKNDLIDIIKEIYLKL